MTTWDQIEAHWTDVQKHFLVRWGMFSRDELDQTQGHRDDLVNRLQERYGKTREEARREIDEWADSLKLD